VFTEAHVVERQESSAGNIINSMKVQTLTCPCCKYQTTATCKKLSEQPHVIIITCYLLQRGSKSPQFMLLWFAEVDSVRRSLLQQHL